MRVMRVHALSFMTLIEKCQTNICIEVKYLPHSYAYHAIVFAEGCSCRASSSIKKVLPSTLAITGQSSAEFIQTSNPIGGSASYYNLTFQLIK